MKQALHNQTLRIAAVLFVVISGVLFTGLDSKEVCAIQVSGKCVQLERAATAAARNMGLSGRDSLADDQGMLFAFDSPNSACMWMKDMNFAIDIVWLDDGKEIISIADNVSPETYPETFCSEEPAKFVVELGAGIAENAGLQPGHKLPL